MMFRKIGTTALRCKHGKLVGIDGCEECNRAAPYMRRQHQVTSPMQNLGMQIQRTFQSSGVPIHPKLTFYPVWAGTMEDMSKGTMVFGLQTGHPREDYEDPMFQLVVKMKIKHTAPWWLRAWRRVTRQRPKPWEQQVGYHYRSDGKGNVRKVTDPSHSRVLVTETSTTCPNCRSLNVEDRTELDQAFDGVNSFFCRECENLWTHERRVG